MTDGEHPDNVLFDWYERYIGEPETETDVYLGFGLFFGAVASAVLALVLFLVGATLYGLRTDGYFAVAQPGYLAGMLSVPLALLGVVVLLPTERRATLGAAAGTAITAVAAVAFLLFYPDQWFEFGTRNTLAVVGTYALGLAVVTAATGAALVAHQLERVRAPAPSEIEAAGEEPDETVTDEQIQSDIEEAMSEVDITWGGVEKTENRKLDFNPDYADESFSDVDVEADQTVRSGTVDAQVQGLQQMKGDTTNVATAESTVDDQTAALNELKRQKEEDEVPANVDTEKGLVARFLGWVGLR